MPLVAVFVLVYCIISICVLSESGPKVGGRPTGRCGACRYDLSGLATSSPCPECGSMVREVKGATPTANPQRQTRWVPTFLLFLTTLVFSYPLAKGVLVVSYRYDHFSVTAALRSMETRELSDHGPGVGGVLLPFLVAVALSPLTSLAPSRRRAAVWLFAAATAGAGATLIYWTLLQPGYQ